MPVPIAGPALATDPDGNAVIPPELFSFETPAPDRSAVPEKIEIGAGPLAGVETADTAGPTDATPEDSAETSIQSDLVSDTVADETFLHEEEDLELIDDMTEEPAMVISSESSAMDEEPTEAADLAAAPEDGGEPASSGTDDTPSDLTVPEEESQPKRGFFARLFGRKKPKKDAPEEPSDANIFARPEHPDTMDAEDS